MSINNKVNKKDLNELPLVSIIVPVFNTEKYINACLDSVLKQTYPNIEIIVIDDGSTDGSSEAIQKYISEHSNIIEYLYQENQGISAARNTGMELARGEYLCFLDSDDLIDISMISSLVALCVKNELDMILFDAKPCIESDYDGNAEIKTNYIRKGSYSSVIGGIEMAESLINNGDFFASACLYLTNRCFLSSTELKFPLGIIHEDEVFTPLLLVNAKKVMHTPEPFYKRRIRNDSIMTSSGLVRSFHGYVSSIDHLLHAKQEYKKVFSSVINLRLKLLQSTAFSLYNSMTFEERKFSKIDYKKLRAASSANSYFGVRAGWLMYYCYPLYRLLRNIKEYTTIKL